MGKYFVKEAMNLAGKLFTQGVKAEEIAAKTGKSVAEVKAIGADVIKGQQTGKTLGRNAKAYGEGKTNLDTFLGNVEPAAKINPRLGTGGSARAPKVTKQVAAEPILARPGTSGLAGTAPANPGIASAPHGNPAPPSLSTQEKAQVELDKIKAHKGDKAKQVLESIKTKKDPAPFDTSNPMINGKAVTPGPTNPFLTAANADKSGVTSTGKGSLLYNRGVNEQRANLLNQIGKPGATPKVEPPVTPKEPDVFDKARATYTKYKDKAKANPWGYGAGAGAVGIGGALAFSGGSND